MCYNCSPLGSDRLCGACRRKQQNSAVVTAALAVAAICTLVLMGDGGTPPEVEVEADQVEVRP